MSKATVPPSSEVLFPERIAQMRKEQLDKDVLWSIEQAKKRLADSIVKVEKNWEERIKSFAWITKPCGCAECVNVAKEAERILSRNEELNFDLDVAVIETEAKYPYHRSSREYERALVHLRRLEEDAEWRAYKHHLRGLPTACDIVKDAQTSPLIDTDSVFRDREFLRKMGIDCSKPPEIAHVCGRCGSLFSKKIGNKKKLCPACDKFTRTKRKCLGCGTVYMGVKKQKFHSSLCALAFYRTPSTPIPERAAEMRKEGASWNKIRRELNIPLSLCRLSLRIRKIEEARKEEKEG